MLAPKRLQAYSLFLLILFAAIPRGAIATGATKRVNLSGNLDSSVAIISPSSIPDVCGVRTVRKCVVVEWQRLVAIASIAQSLYLKDSLGHSHLIEVLFFKTRRRTWQVRVYTDGKSVSHSPMAAGLLFGSS
jgi:hypothetical protein